MVCTIPRCGRKVLAHGLCSTHVMRRRARQLLTRPVKPQRSYSSQDVKSAVELAETVGVKPAAKELDIPRNTLRHWVKGTRRATGP